MYWAYMKHTLHKLFTHADPFHVHKVLGAAALISFMYTYAYAWPTTGSLGASRSLIWLHVALSASGIQFRVPLRRVRAWPTMIWEEYRLHAIVFSLRPLVVAYTPPGPVRAMGVAAVHALADIVTARYGSPGHSTVRGNHQRDKSWRIRVLMRTYAAYQWLALASHLVGVDGVQLGYNAFIAIQSSAFCMTLHRKGLIRWQTHAAVYLACTGASAAYICATVPSLVVVAAACAGAVRANGVNKYVAWGCFWHTASHL